LEEDGHVDVLQWLWSEARCHSLSQSLFEYQENNNFFHKIGNSAAKTPVRLNTVYGDNALEKSAVCDWYN
jgi:hypothetical protein